MAVNVRLEWIRLDQVDGPESGGGEDHPVAHFGTELLTVAGSQELSGPAPVFDESKAKHRKGFAKLIVDGGAVEITWGRNPTVSAGAGMLIDAAEGPRLISIASGDKIAFIAAPGRVGAAVTEPGARGVVPMTGDVDYAPGRGLQVCCSEAGDVSLVMADGSTNLIPVDYGLNVLPFCVKRWVSAATTATATFAQLV